MTTHVEPSRIRVALAAALIVSGMAGCSDNKNAGAAQPGGLLGVITGTVSVTKSGATSPQAGVQVTVSPDYGAVAVTDSSGAYTLSAPAGSYTVNFSGDNLASDKADGVVVPVGGSVTVDKTLSPSALQLKMAAPSDPTGFEATAKVSVTGTVNGAAATIDGVTYSVSDYYGTAKFPAPIQVAADGTVTVPDFETLRQAANALMQKRYATDSSYEYIKLEPRPQIAGMGPQQAREMSFRVKATARSGNNVSTVSAVISPLVYVSTGTNIAGPGLVGGEVKPDSAGVRLASVPVGVPVLVSDSPGLTYSWTLSSASASPEPLTGATSRVVSFTPLAEGKYKLTNGSTVVAFYASRYTGGLLDPDGHSTGARCMTCHSSSPTVTGLIDEWRSSAHGNFFFEDSSQAPQTLFQYGMSGGAAGTSYGADCAVCHTVGFYRNSKAVNGGFDEQMGSTALPTPGATAWASIPDLAREQAGIQCETCHGPLGQHPGNPQAAPQAKWSAETCAQCHDSLTHHDRFPLWSASAHASLDLTLADATIEARGASAAHCGRCHTAQGFVQYVSQQTDLMNDPNCQIVPISDHKTQTANTNVTQTYTGNLLRVNTNTDGSVASCSIIDTFTGSAKDTPATTFPLPADVAFLSNLGMTAANAQSQTCQACHDPHTTELRVKDSVSTAAGWSASGVGAGALCMDCHNQRNGSHDDATGHAPTSFSAPHKAAQSDLFVGRSLYFTGAPASNSDLSNMAKHGTEFADTCVRCHMQVVAPDTAKQFSPASTNHTFGTTTAVCANCHGGDVDPKGIQDATKAELAVIAGVVSGKLVTKLNGLTGGFQATLWNPSPDGNSSGKVSFAGRTITAISYYEIHGQFGLVLTLDQGLDSFTWASGAVEPAGKKDNIYVQLGSFYGSDGTTKVFDPTKTTTITSQANSVALAEIFWNYYLVNGEGTFGLHNPVFTPTVLSATKTAADGLSL